MGDTASRATGWMTRVEWLLAYARGRANAVATTIVNALSALLQLLSHRVQRLGPASQGATTIFFDSAAYTLFPSTFLPGLLPGSPTVKVTGSMSVTGTPGDSVTFALIRDRGTGSPVVLTEQTTEIGATTVDGASMTLVFLDTASTVDAVSGVPSPLLDLSTHTWSIVAVDRAEALTGNGNALVLLEQ